MDSQEKDQDQQTPPTSPTTSDFEHGQHLSDSERLDSETQIPQSPSPAAAPSPRTSELECGQHWGDSERLDSETQIPQSPSPAAVLAEEVYDVLIEFNSIQTLKAVLVDNTNTNTGGDGGLVTLLEKKLQRKLHTIGCSLHQNELPFRAVFKHLDGSTKSPTAFTGPLGKLL